jgi:hypothetical protein
MWTAQLIYKSGGIDFRLDGDDIIAYPRGWTGRSGSRRPGTLRQNNRRRPTVDDAASERSE